MKYKIISFSLLLFLTLVISACDDNSGSRESFRNTIELQFLESDANMDGFISGTEIDAIINQDFDTMDTNMDGVITEADHVGDEYLTELNGEVLEFNASVRGELIDDTNDDQVLTFEEYSNAVQSKYLEVADADEDGQISLAEAFSYQFVLPPTPAE